MLYLTRVRSDKKYCVIWTGDTQSSLSNVQKHLLDFCGGWIIFNITTSFPQTKPCKPNATLLLCPCQWFRRAAFLTSSSPNFKVMIHYAIYTETNNPHWIFYSISKVEVYSGSVCGPLLSETDFRDENFPELLICSRLVSTAIYSILISSIILIYW